MGIRLDWHTFVLFVGGTGARLPWLPAADWARGLPPEVTRFGHAWLTAQLLRYIVRPAAHIARPEVTAAHFLFPFFGHPFTEFLLFLWLS